MRTYPAKLLLFGEHILLMGSSALAMPMPAYHGRWEENGKFFDPDLYRKLLLFAKCEHLLKTEVLDVTTFYQDIQNGLVFESGIPVGYGLGSSGALCAAVYDRYSLLKTSDLNALKVIFAGMESFFHGLSSGIDPLVSYVEKPLLIQHKTEVSLAETANGKTPPVVFLIDSLLPRQTGPLVHWFLEKSKHADFSRKLKMDYLLTHETMVRNWLSADFDVFWSNLHRISRFQLDNFDPMIPETLRDLWEDHLENQQITFKICGAGGGGFMLGFCRNRAQVEDLESEYNIVFPFSTQS